MKPATSTQNGSTPHWSRIPERSNDTALRLMSWIALRCGRRLSRLVLLPVTLYFVLFARTARRNSRRYLRRALGRAPRFTDIFRHMHAFASVTLDRVYLLRHRRELFDIRVADRSVADELNRPHGPRGAFLLGAHLGSFEVLKDVGEAHAEHIALVMYPDNARKINAALRAIAPDAAPAIIQLGQTGSMLAVREWLERGGVAGMLGDRVLESESARSPQRCIGFLGQPAWFGDGPLRMAALMKRRVFFMAGIYLGGNRYDVRFELLADFTAEGLDAQARDRLIDEALARYVVTLESICRAHPMNWFNFHDFWREDEAAHG